MEKIKITREQEEALKVWNSYQEKLETFVKERGMWTQSFKPLNNFTPEQFALLLCGWYEVEHPFKVGDWVYNNKVKGYRKIVNERMNQLTNWNEVSILFVTENTERYEKVTEPWKIMLLELGREKPEFKIGDKYITSSANDLTISHETMYLSYKAANENRMKYFYPMESRIELKEENK